MPAARKPSERQGIRVSPMARAPGRASHDVSDLLWQVAPPPPHVLPEGAPTMAQDDMLAGFSPYAASNVPPIFGLTSGAGFLPWLGYPFLALLAQQPEYRIVVETYAREMTRKWIKLQSRSGNAKQADKIKRLDAAMKRFDVRKLFRKMAVYDGFFGRGHIFADTGIADPGVPLIADKRALKKGALKALRSVEPVWTYPAPYNSTNPLAEGFYEPHRWFVMGKEVHKSRLMTFVGREVPDVLKPMYQFGGLSISQMLKPSIDNYLRSRQSTSDLLHSFSVMVLHTPLGDTGNVGGGGDLAGRVTLFNQYRDNSGCMVVDKEQEDLSNVSAPLGGIDHLRAQDLEQLSVISGIPHTILLGNTPTGLNATGEGEIRAWYDKVHAFQEHLFGPNLDFVLSLVQLNEFGDIDEDIGYEFVSLWQLDEAARAAQQKSVADTRAEYVAMGAVDNAEVREQLSAETDGVFPNIDLSGPPPEPEPDDFEAENETGNPARGEENASEV